MNTLETSLAQIQAVDELRGKRVGVVGLGLSNLSLISFLAASEPELTVFDRQTENRLVGRIEQVRAACPTAVFVAGPDYLDRLAAAEPFDYLFLTPGIKKDQPQLLEACSGDTRVSSEMSLFFDLCPAPITGITGSAGKTTTTSLVGRLLGSGEAPVHVGGNIGTPLITRVLDVQKTDKVVVEVSSFQLELMTKGPRVAAVLNLSPNHLDVHGGMAAYVAAKRRICELQPANGTAVLNYDNSYTRDLASDCPGRVLFFSMERSVDNGACLEEGRIVLRQAGRTTDWSGLPTEAIPLRGRHNVANVMAAVLVAWANDVSTDCFEEAVRSFHAVPHRLELVRERNGVRYYNDSIATAPDRTLAALASFSEPIVLIAGGYDKGIPFEPLAPAVVDKVYSLVLLGATAQAIEQAVDDAATAKRCDVPNIEHAESLEEAVQTAARLAKPGSVVLLSPACASFDMFTNFEERGDRFRDLVREL